MTPEDPLGRLARLLDRAAVLTRDLCDDGLPERAAALVDRVPADELQALIDLVAGEVEVYRLRLAGSTWTHGSQMHVNRMARVYARTAPHDDTDPLREATARGTRLGVRFAVAQLAGAPVEPCESLRGLCDAVPLAERREGLVIARRLLQRILDVIPPAAANSGS